MIVGGSGKDQLGSGNSAEDNGLGKDTLEGGSGDDEIFGGPDKDTLRGGLDDDTLNGGQGGDLLNGGAGRDVFVASGGRDVVMDFRSGVDKIDLRGPAVSFGFANLDDVRGHVGNPSATSITLNISGNSSIQITGYSLSELSSGDFIF